MMRRMCVFSRLMLLAALISCMMIPASSDRTVQAAQAADATDAALHFQGRKRVETAPGSGEFKVVEQDIRWAPEKTAVVICDMWNKHWCKAATRRVAEMAPRMNQVISNLRDRGVLIIHCPSGTLDYYKDTPQRKLAQAAPPVETRIPLQGWCSLSAEDEAPLPIDDSDGGCNDVPQCNGYQAWSREIDTLEIKDGDAITDSAEAYYLMKQRGIENVIVMGVHTNMCVLGRPFSIRQMVYQGQNVVLMRDMTDTMYNSRMAPYVSHFRGTDLVINHIEKYWVPTITSDQVLGGQPFHFKNDVRPNIVVAIAEPEYHTNETLANFVNTQWRDLQGFNVKVIQGDPSKHNLPHFAEALQNADLLVLSVRRQALPSDQMQALHDYLAAGKPLIAIRTCSHAFDAHGQGPANHVEWPNFDEEVLGGNYQGHHANNLTDTITIAYGAEDSPLLERIETPFTSGGSLYQSGPVSASATPLLLGHVEGAHAEPVAWTNTYGQAKIFYTSLGHSSDFANSQLPTLLDNAMRWELGLPIPHAPKDFTKAWQPIDVPAYWNTQYDGDLGKLDGFAWYRCWVKVPANWSGKNAMLDLGRIDDCDETFINGQKIGATGVVPPKEVVRQSADWRKYSVPASTLKPGQWNMIAVRVFDGGGQAGIYDAKPALTSDAGTINLTGQWQFRAGDDMTWAQPISDSDSDIPDIGKYE